MAQTERQMPDLPVLLHSDFMVVAVPAAGLGLVYLIATFGEYWLNHWRFRRFVKELKRDLTSNRPLE